MTVTSCGRRSSSQRYVLTSGVTDMDPILVQAGHSKPSRVLLRGTKGARRSQPIYRDGRGRGRAWYARISKPEALCGVHLPNRRWPRVALNH